MPALLVWCYADGVFSSRRLERAADRDIGARFIAANTHPWRIAGWINGSAADPPCGNCPLFL
jgi:hypothetical protein